MKRIALIKGDGIGPEIVDAAVCALNAAAGAFGETFEYESVLAGGASIDETGVPLTEGALETCLSCDAVLLGAVGGPKWDGLAGDKRPERALLGLRKALGLYSNLRPARLFPILGGACPLKPEIALKGVDLVIVRELTGGLYFGKRGLGENGAFDTLEYSRAEIERIARAGFETARSRRKKLTSVDKANVLDTSRLWRAVVHELASDYPDVALDDMLVDNAAMQLVRDPSQFDVIVTENMFGDILSDEAAMITGSIGMLPSASLGQGPGLFEPAHGSAPDIAGKGIANPLATILSAAMMARYSLGLPQIAGALEQAVEKTLESGLRTHDIADGGDWVGTAEITRAVVSNIKRG